MSQTMNLMTRDQIEASAVALRAEAEAMTALSDAIGKFENLTGRKLCVMDKPLDASKTAEAGAQDAVPEALSGPVAGGMAIPSIHVAEGAVRVAGEVLGARKAKAVVETAEAKPKRKMLGDGGKWTALSLPQRRIVRHLEGLPDIGTSPAQDHDIVQCLISGIKPFQISDELGVSEQTVVKRWKSMWCSDVVGQDGRPTIDGQANLLAALKYLAG